MKISIHRLKPVQTKASEKGAFLFSVLFVLAGFMTGCQQNHPNTVEDLYLPEVITFAGDTIPVDDPDIRERLERELWINVYWHSNTAQLIRKSGRWFPMMDSVLKQEGIPDDFKYLVAIESSFENVTSNKGAVGFWQLMEPTAREFDLQINEEIDERLHPTKSTVAATRLLKRGRAVLGHWSAVAASYNVGITGLKRVMDSQYTDHFYDLLINQETGRYLFRALACKLIFTQPEKYGYGKLTPLTPYPTVAANLDSTVTDLAYWCRSKGFSYKCFRQVNPWIKSNRLTVSDSIPAYSILLPTQCRVYTTKPLILPNTAVWDTATQQQDAVFQHLINQKDMKALKSAEEPTPVLETVHVVKPGENLSLIASKYHSTPEDLFRLNPDLEKKKNRISAGMKIVVKRP